MPPAGGLPLFPAQKKEAFLLPSIGNRQRPILPGRVQPSTFGTGELNCCVRYGNRWDLSVITTGKFSGGLRPAGLLPCGFLPSWSNPQPAVTFPPLHGSLPFVRSPCSVPLRFLPFRAIRFRSLRFRSGFWLFPALHLSAHPDNCTSSIQSSDLHN